VFDVTRGVFCGKYAGIKKITRRSIPELPIEIWSQIASFVDYRTWTAIRCVSKLHSTVEVHGQKPLIACQFIYEKNYSISEKTSRFTFRE
jgi:hypothetical protein